MWLTSMDQTCRFKYMILNTGILFNEAIFTVALFCSQRFIANAGDARAVLGVQEEDGSFSALTLSNDHNAQNEDEVSRIRSEHPPSERKTVIRQVLQLLIRTRSVLIQAFVLSPLLVLGPQDRLLGLLMPFRAFGDVKFKWSIELQKCVLESGPDQLHENEHTKFIPPNYHTPPYLTAEPEITYHKLRPQDRFLVREVTVSSIKSSVKLQ